MYDLKEDVDVVTKQFKVVVLGDGAVGKTSICNRFSTDQFNQSYKQTIGVDFFTKKINLPPNTEGERGMGCCPSNVMSGTGLS